MARGRGEELLIVDAAGVVHTRPPGGLGNGTGDPAHNSFKDQDELFAKYKIRCVRPMTLKRRGGSDNAPPTALIVGAGFAGSVCARVLADAGWQVQIIDRRPHVGGNAFDHLDENGVLVHPYGPHIFHTRSRDVLKFLSRFTLWRFYEHRVLASVEGKLLPMPINRTTLNELYGMKLTPAQASDYLESVREARSEIRTSEDVVLNSVGADLCGKFYRGYTFKQWGRDLSEISAGVAARIPVRSNDDDRYFADEYQFMPYPSYQALFARMLSHPFINVQLDIDFNELDPALEFDHLVYTGPVDSFFRYVHGALEYRSLRFEHFHLSEVDKVQSVGTINFPNEHDYTRITEFKHLTGQECLGSSLVREYPCAEGDPFYPMPDEANSSRYRLYKEECDKLDNVTFVGRLAQYKYFNMDQVVAAALAAARRIIDNSSPLTGAEGE